MMASVARGKWRRRSREEWRGVLERFAASGLTIRQFCDREGLSKSSFERWRALLGEERSQPSQQARSSADCGFVDAGLVDVGRGQAAQRLELTLDLGGWLVLHLVRG